MKLDSKTYLVGNEEIKQIVLAHFGLVEDDLTDSYWDRGELTLIVPGDVEPTVESRVVMAHELEWVRQIARLRLEPASHPYVGLSELRYDWPGGTGGFRPEATSLYKWITSDYGRTKEAS